jgi:hypothetical protein
VSASPLASLRLVARACDGCAAAVAMAPRNVARALRRANFKCSSLLRYR